MEKGGIPLQSMFFTGQAITPGSKGAATVTYLSNRWNTGRVGSDYNWGCAVAGSNNKGCAYSMFNAFKGLKLMGITTLPGVTRAAGPGAQPAGDWYADYQDWLMAEPVVADQPDRRQLGHDGVLLLHDLDCQRGNCGVDSVACRAGAAG